ncbi:hypothetical protein CYLTODRAFT_416671 [Cylindrobasidium torrendii FP15055 ss-10]|uniref:Vacuole protein n=1 Tax=Cylindrobasidium torrendii FP15055 ss-10 TaxID=1314674 RepID=A0A0D7BVH9_9AGAR|nr:hypothetical protein CYLTODRAFT_416671 [Cylindrobasidium torrendii FP15055 ss-10]
MCFSGPKWKREIVPDHKFDFVDTREFVDNGCFMRLKYFWLYLIVLKSFAVYIVDIYTATTMLSSTTWSNEIFNNCEDLGCITIPFQTGKWLFVGCIIFSFLLLGYESYKAKKIVASRDISYAFTNIQANNYYSIRSYPHFCFFDHISNSTKTSDDFAFFVFFTFKSWKRVLLADGPRQTINALTLYAVYLVHVDDGPWYDVTKYFIGNSASTTGITLSTFFTVLVFFGSLLLLIVAGLCYVPLLCHIRGNLKEYCCHKVDKRIDTVIKRRQKQRLAEASKFAQKEAMGDYSHLKNKKGELVGQPLPQPTLPNLSVEDDFDDRASLRSRGPPPSTFTNDNNYYYSDNKSEYPPPMPAYNPAATYQNPGSYPHFNPSQGNMHEESLYNYPPQGLYEDDNESTAHLALSAAPFAQGSQSQLGIDRPGTAPPPSGYSSSTPAPQYDPYDVYQGRAATTTPSGRRSSRQQFTGYDTGRQDDYYGAYGAQQGQQTQYSNHTGYGGGAGGYAM